MSFKSLREKLYLSQERVAEMSGLSLRTVQRLEAGHRVSYASLRALAATFSMDADLLERELYAAKSSSDEFVEVPRWVRRLREGISGGLLVPGRKQAYVCEAFAVILGAAFLIGMPFVTSALAKATFLVAGCCSLICGYGLSVATRVVDAYAGWHPQGSTDAIARPSISLGYRLCFYLAALLLAAAFLWLVVSIAA